MEQQLQGRSPPPRGRSVSREAARPPRSPAGGRECVQTLLPLPSAVTFSDTRETHPGSVPWLPLPLTRGPRVGEGRDGLVASASQRWFLDAGL